MGKGTRGKRSLHTLSVLVWMLVLMLASTSCTSYRNYRAAQMAASAEDWDQAVLYYMQATDRDPENITYRAALLRAKIRASQEHFEKARRYYEAEVLERALIEYQQAVQLDPSNQSAIIELERVRHELTADRDDRRRETSLDEMKRRVSEKNQPPVLNPRSDEPIDLDFPEQVSILQIYQALGRAFGINVLFDPDLKPQEIAVELKQVRSRDALEYLMRAANHFYKVLDEESIIIIADTPQKRRIYEDLVIKTFFLSNADVKDVVTMLRTLIDAKKIATNEQLNAIILRDTADKVKVAERIIQANDKAKAEVVVNVELLQINTSKLKDIGVTWPGQVTATLDVGGENTPLRLSDLEFINQSNWVLSIPSFIYDFVKTTTNAQLLAKPQLRISEGEKASLVIGDRVPIPVTSFNTGNTVGGNIVPITSFQYQEVGIKINLEPRVHHNKEITLKVTVEVSNLSGQVQSGQTSQPIIGTRTIESTIRLKDGETNFLAGLIRTDETVSDSGVPGLSEIPIIGRLFSNNRNQNQRTDVILTLTPHIIRAADITEEDLLPIWVGTEQNMTFRGGSPRVESDVEGPFDGNVDPNDRENIRELIQRRIQQLPRGLRNQGGEENGSPEGPTGTELVPGSPPDDPFNNQEEEEDPSPFGVPDPGEEEPPTVPRDEDNRFVSGNASGALRLGGSLPAVVFAAATPRSPVSVRLAPAEMRLVAGDSFQVSVRVDARQKLSHLPLRLVYDPQALEVVEVRRGDFLGSESEAQVLADFATPGTVLVGASRLGEIGPITGSGTLLTLTFRALTPGTAEISIEGARALRGDLSPAGPVAVEGARVEVSRPVERPERPELPPEKT